MNDNNWIETDTDTNAIVTATRAAEPNAIHVPDYAQASYNDPTVSGLLEILINGVVVASYYVHGADTVPLGVIGGANQAYAARLAAGGAGIIGTINLVGRTR